jgi:hypothetical protein
MGLFFEDVVENDKVDKSRVLLPDEQKVREISYRRLFT